MTAVSVALPQPPDSVDFASLVESHQANVWRYLRYLGAESAEADDLVQETFLAVYRSHFVHECDAKTGGYLRTTARNQLLMLRRRQRREPNIVDLEMAEVVWAERLGDGPASGYLDALAECLKRIDGRARQAIDLHYREKTGRQEIAKQLSMKPEGVKTLLRRTRDALRDCIERRVNRAAEHGRASGQV